MSTTYPAGATVSATSVQGLRALVSVSTLAAAVAGLGLLYVAQRTAGATALSFADNGLQNIANIMAPLVLVALFIERAVEVVVSAWRDEGAKSLEHVCATAEAGSQPYAVRNLSMYKVQTMRLAMIVSFSLACFAALVGVRAVAPLLDASAVAGLSGGQLLWFSRFDIGVTALLIAGGAEGLHQIVSTFTDFLEKTRGNLQPDPTPAPARAAAPAPAAAAGSDVAQG